MTTASPAQIEANRRNARHSTGPKTPEGKVASRMNALKHAVLARQILIHGRDIDESTGEFQDFCAEYHEHLAPVGPLEEMLVDQIVAVNWRLRRARMAETAEITLSVDNVRRRHNDKTNPDLQWAIWLSVGDPIYNMRKTVIGNSVLEIFIRKLRDTVDREGELTEAVIQELTRKLGDKPNSLTRQLEKFRLELLKNPEGLDPAILRENNRKAALEYLDDTLRELSESISSCSEDEYDRIEKWQAAAVLPSEETLQKILRYESTLEKQLFRAMDQLERLQRRRLGQKTASSMPPEIAADDPGQKKCKTNPN
jgi:hypothetical protein